MTTKASGSKWYNTIERTGEEPPFYDYPSNVVIEGRPEEILISNVESYLTSRMTKD